MSFNGYNLFPPAATTFTNLNFISGTAVSSVGSNQVLYIPAATGDNVVGQYVAAPSTPYCLIANLVANQGDQNNTAYTNVTAYGIGFYDGTKLQGIFSEWASGTSQRLSILSFNSVSSLNSATWGNKSQGGQPTGMMNWFQIRDDGTNIYYYVAMDGTNGSIPTHWVKLYQASRLTFLANVNNICYWCDSNSNSTPTYLTLQSWQTLSL